MIVLWRCCSPGAKTAGHSLDKTNMINNRTKKRGLLFLFLGGFAMSYAQPEPGIMQPRIPDYTTVKHLSQIEAIERNYNGVKPPEGLIIVTGDSDVVLWDTLQEDLAPHPAWNCGFGGGTVIQAAYYADRIVIPYQPAVVILNAGDNDLGVGTTVEEVVQDTEWFVSKIQAALPDTLIYIMSIKYTEARNYIQDKLEETNRQLVTLTAGRQNVRFVDVTSAMLNADGSVRTELYRKDRLHMSPEGYRIYANVISKALADDRAVLPAPNPNPAE
jgi:hypothetical protein